LMAYLPSIALLFGLAYIRSLLLNLEAVLTVVTFG
jgi:hypothetical protein